MCVEGEPLGLDITSIENVRADRRQLVNVGSVGQPRGRDAQACYAVYRREQRDIWWRRVPYDVEGAQGEIIRAGLPPYLAQRLAIGK
jgi:diadenosine tetraphosphatase ApaH/serine/threonine PP2A family protein phosphatase